MKKIILILSLLLFTNLTLSARITYEAEDGSIFTGDLNEDNEMHGIFGLYDSNDEFRMYFNFENGETNGEFEAYIGDNIKMIGKLIDGKINGEAVVYFFDEEVLLAEGLYNYVDDMVDGEYTISYEMGVIEKGEIKKDVRVGERVFTLPNGYKIIKDYGSGEEEVKKYEVFDNKGNFVGEYPIDTYEKKVEEILNIKTP